MDSISSRGHSIGSHRAIPDSLQSKTISKDLSERESGEIKLKRESNKTNLLFTGISHLFSRSHRKSTDLQSSRFQHIASGKAKHVFADRLSERHVYYTPVTGIFEKIFGTKKAEIQEEVRVASQIKQSLAAKGVGVGSETHIATDLREIEGTDDLQGQYVVQAPKAGEAGKKSDLDKLLKDSFNLTDRFSFCEQILKGISHLHLAGYVHGDLKGDNILHFREQQPNGEIKSILRVSDFGKSRQVQGDSSILHTGNLRFAAPEGKMNKKAEVFSAALLLVRVLEEDILQKQGQDMIIRPDQTKSDQTGENHRGITKFLVSNDHCVQTDSKNIQGKIRLISGSARAIMNVKGETQKSSFVETKKYIQALFSELRKDKSANQIKGLDRMEQLLLSMVQENPSMRPTLFSALEQFAEAQKLYHSGIVSNL